MRTHARVFLTLGFLACALQFVLPNPALAQATTYAYQGNPYNPATSACNGTYVPCIQLAVRGSFTVSAPLAANLSFSSITPSAFSFTDGVTSLTNSSSLSVSSFAVSTDANGNIVSWAIELATVTSFGGCLVNNQTIGTLSNPAPPNGDGQAGDFSCFLTNQNTSSQSFGSGGNRNVPGNWTDPVKILQSLTNLINIFGLKQGTATSLISKVDAAIISINGNLTPQACSDLSDLVGEAQDQSGTHLTANEAHSIVTVVTQIRSSLGCS